MPEQYAKAQLQMDGQDEFLMAAAYWLGINTALKAVIGTDDKKLNKATIGKVLPFITGIVRQEKTSMTGYDEKNVKHLAMNLLEQKCGKSWLVQIMAGAPNIEQLFSELEGE